MDDFERRRRLWRAHQLIRAELVIAFAAPVIAGFLYVAAPGGPTPMVQRELPIQGLIPWAGVLGVIVGIIWMVRLSRANPEAGERSWRYRDYE